jgi:nanoRNase/pAp phosphatase (c-di-AMP/oligoRNAs hydrolase)
MRVVTRSDMDGLVCAVLLKEVENIEEITFVHPKDVQDGKVEITQKDILTNIPYDPRCGMCFDHHISEATRTESIKDFKGAIEIAPSAARVIYNYYGGTKKLDRFEKLLNDVDAIDSAKLTIDDINNPTGWILLGFVLDSRTGLGKYRNFKISNYQLMMNMTDWIGKNDISEILEFDDVKERTEMYFKHNEEFTKHLKNYSRLEKNIAITDQRSCEEIPTGNRFAIYTLFPTCNVSIRIFWGFKKQNIVCAVGHNIFNRNCNTNVGELMSQYGGGGHFGAGTCQLEVGDADTQLKNIVDVIQSNG